MEKTTLRTACSLGEALERGGAEQAIGGDVAVFHFGQEFRLDPRGLRVADWLGKFRRGAHHGIELLADLAGHCPRPARSDLARVDQVFSLLPAEVERGYAGCVLHKADHREFAALEASMESGSSKRNCSRYTQRAGRSWEGSGPEESRRSSLREFDPASCTTRPRHWRCGGGYPKTHRPIRRRPPPS
jgi:hypothetical protein